MEEYRREILFNKITFENSAASIHDMATGNIGKCLCKIESIKIPKYLLPNFDQIAIWLGNADSSETVCHKDDVDHATMALSDYMFV